MCLCVSCVFGWDAVSRTCVVCIRQDDGIPFKINFVQVLKHTYTHKYTHKYTHTRDLVEFNPKKIPPMRSICGWIWDKSHIFLRNTHDFRKKIPPMPKKIPPMDFDFGGFDEMR